MFLSSELRGLPRLPVGAVLIAVGLLLVPVGVALVTSAGWGVLVAGLLALGFGVDAARDELPAAARPTVAGTAGEEVVEQLRLVGVGEAS